MSPRRAAWLCLLGLALQVIGSTRVQAHALSPPALSIRERAPLSYDVTYRRTPLADARLTLDWPSGCRASEVVTTQDADQLRDELKLVCTQELAGQTLRVFGLLELELSMMVFVVLHEGPSVRALLSAEQPSLVVPRRERALDVLRDYTAMGVSHLLAGPDHVLFLLGLLLIVSAPRARLFAVTMFTLGHSITLCLSALSVIRLPQAPVELGIAASLVVLALEVLRTRQSAGALQARVSTRRAGLMAAGFGLFHGLGFASALRESGLPDHALSLALFGFNLGVELGQLLVVLALLPCLYVIRHVRHEQRDRLRSVAAYAMGSLAAMWCIERAVAVL